MSTNFQRVQELTADIIQLKDVASKISGINLRGNEKVLVLDSHGRFDIIFNQMKKFAEQSITEQIAKLTEEIKIELDAPSFEEIFEAEANEIVT